MRRNPEFLRNIWLEITPHRLVATPLIMGAIYYLILFSGDHNESGLLMTSLWAFVLLTGLWGAYQAENSVVTEIQNKTWPLQRLTSINPWAMTWGKLFGSTLFSWYSGLWSLLVFFLTWLLTPEIYLFASPDKKWVLLSHGIGPAILLTVGLALWFQAWGFLMGMYHLQNKESQSKRKSGISSIISLVFLPTLIISSFQPVGDPHVLHWYQWGFNQFWFWLASLYVFLGWLMTGIYMQMRRELQVSNPPWVWAAFMVFLLGYVMGFFQGREGISPSDPNLWVLRLLFGWMLMTGLTYLILWWERADGVGVRRLFHLWNSSRIHDALCEVPRWLVGLIVTGATVTGLIILQVVYGESPFSMLTIARTLSGMTNFDNGDTFNLYGFVIASMCFLMRDIALLLYFYFSDKPQRALGTAFVYWVVLYLLVPLLLGVVWMDALNPLFLPDGTVNIVYAVLPPLLQAGLMWAFTIRRWRTRFGSSVI
jgi:hypothetical protein